MTTHGVGRGGFSRDDRWGRVTDRFPWASCHAPGDSPLNTHQGGEYAQAVSTVA